MPNNDDISQLSVMRASMGLVITGPCGELANILGLIERYLPDGVRIVYKRFSPGHIYLTVEGTECGKGCR